MSSLAQDELGHAAALYGLLGGAAPAATPTRSPTTASRPSTATPGCSTTAAGDWAMTIARRYLYETADAVRLEALADGSWPPLAELVGKIRREERYHLMHVGPWFERLATASGEPRDRLRRRARDAGPGRRDGVHAARRRSRRSSRPGSWPADGRRSRRAGAPTSRRRSRPLGLPMPPPAAAPADGRTRPRRAVPLAVERVHDGPPRATRARRGDRGRGRRPTEADVRAAPRDGPRPGAARSCRSSTSGSSIASRSAATTGSRSSSCRRSSAARRSTSSAPRSTERLARASAGPVQVEIDIRVPVDVGPDHAPPAAPAFAAAGIAPPAEPSDVRCPFCDSARRRRWTAPSARRSAARCSTAAPAASRSRRSSRLTCRRRSSASSGPGRWAPASPRSRSRPARRSSSMTSTGMRSSALQTRIRDGLARRAASLDLDADSIDDWVDGRLAGLRDAHLLDGLATEAALIDRGRARGPRAEADGLPSARCGGAGPTPSSPRNTSALSITAIADGDAPIPSGSSASTSSIPVPLMALVEVVAGELTDPAVVATAEALRPRLGQDAGPLRRLAGLHRQPGQPAVHHRGAPDRRGGPRRRQRRSMRRCVPPASRWARSS